MVTAMKSVKLQYVSSSRAVIFGVALLACMMVGQAMADESQAVRLSQTIEQSAGRTHEQQQEMLDLAPLQMGPELVLSGSRTEADVALKVLSAHTITEQYFHIYDAHTVLSGDDDEDSFFHKLRVTFDADVDMGDAYVYARLFLSYEGGPWNHYFTTDLFYIQEDASYDNYEVVTQLLEGYPTGYYDVLIELYEADWDVHVTSYGPYEDTALSALPLEDQERDTYYPSDGGGGSLGLFSLMLLGPWWGMRVWRSKSRGTRLRIV